MAETTRRSKRTKRISVLVVDDHPLWLDTLRKVLEHGGCRVVAEASRADEAIRVAGETQPDVVVMDVNLPGVDGIAATRQLLDRTPNVRVLALSSSDEPSSVVGIVRAGASGYVVKTAGAAEVVEAVRRVHGGELVFPPELAAIVLDELRHPAADHVEPLSVVLADETALHREGLARLLGEAGVEVVGQADNADSVLQLIATTEPHVALVDVEIAVQRMKAGRRLVQVLRDRFPSTGVLVLAAEVQSSQALRLMSGGSAGLGYVLRERVADVTELVEVIRRVNAGQPVVDRGVVDGLVRRPGARNSLSTLTAREREVLALMAEGRSNQAICERLVLNPKSIESHVRNIFTKLGLELAPDDHRRVLAVLTFLSEQPSEEQAR
jgi:DNA-binding NarL/FixJ family response regulator